jgi:hypothetical protein
MTPLRSKQRRREAWDLIEEMQEESISFHGDENLSASQKRQHDGVLQTPLIGSTWALGVIFDF